MKISKEQKTILIFFGIFILSLLVFLFAMYLPARTKLIEIKREVAGIESELATLQTLSNGKDMGEAIRRLESQLAVLMHKVSISQEKAIKEISGAARDNELEIINLNAAEKRPYANSPAGFAIDEVPLSMHVTGGYRKIGEFLLRLHGDFPVLVRVVRLTMKGKGHGGNILDADLQLIAYVKR